MTATDIETHPWEPWLPADAKVLIMGSFPPAPKRWAMDFFYPNRTNDFWKVAGIIFEGDSGTYYDITTRSYRLDRIKEMLTRKGIALTDTAYRIRRLKGNASDKFLEVLEPVDLEGILKQIPGCRAIATTGEKAAITLATMTGTQAPAVGTSVEWHRPDGSTIAIWRLPSTSRAYPLAPEKKADVYRRFFEAEGLI